MGKHKIDYRDTGIVVSALTSIRRRRDGERNFSEPLVHLLPKTESINMGERKRIMNSDCSPKNSTWALRIAELLKNNNGICVFCQVMLYDDYARLHRNTYPAILAKNAILHNALNDKEVRNVFLTNDKLKGSLIKTFIDPKTLNFPLGELRAIGEKESSKGGLMRAKFPTVIIASTGEQWIDIQKSVDKLMQLVLNSSLVMFCGTSSSLHNIFNNFNNAWKDVDFTGMKGRLIFNPELIGQYGKKK